MFLRNILINFHLFFYLIFCSVYYSTSSNKNVIKKGIVNN